MTVRLTVHVRDTASDVVMGDGGPVALVDTVDAYVTCERCVGIRQELKHATVAKMVEHVLSEHPEHVQQAEAS